MAGRWYLRDRSRREHRVDCCLKEPRQQCASAHNCFPEPVPVPIPAIARSLGESITEDSCKAELESFAARGRFILVLGRPVSVAQDARDFPWKPLGR